MYFVESYENTIIEIWQRSYIIIIFVGKYSRCIPQNTFKIIFLAIHSQWHLAMSNNVSFLLPTHQESQSVCQREYQDGDCLAPFLPWLSILST